MKGKSCTDTCKTWLFFHTLGCSVLCVTKRTSGLGSEVRAVMLALNRVFCPQVSKAAQ